MPLPQEVYDAQDAYNRRASDIAQTLDPKPALRDYWVSATVRNAKGCTWDDVRAHLWTKRIQARDLAAARECAILMIVRANLEYLELQVLWNDAEAVIAEPKG